MRKVEGVLFHGAPCVAFVNQPERVTGRTVMEKINCWEYQKCGTEKDCPAYPIYGRLCFSVKGTLCRGEVQGDYQAKIKRCRTECDFYKDIIGM